MAKRGGQDTGSSMDAVGWLGRSGYQYVIVDPSPAPAASPGQVQGEPLAASPSADDCELE